MAMQIHDDEIKEKAEPIPNIFEDRVLLSISGEIYETRTKTLERFPHTLLGDRRKRLVYYNGILNQYFLNRSRIFFDAILYYYQSYGILHCPQGVCMELFMEECRFYEISEEAIENLKIRESYTIVSNALEEEKNPKRNEASTLRGKMWNVIQNPETSTTAKYFAIFSMSMIVLSVATSCLETLNVLQVQHKKFEKNPWAIVEFVLNSWFLFEITSRVICTPNRIGFFKSSMNWLDILSVVPYFVIFTFSKDHVASLGFLRIIRLIRIVRLLRFSHHSATLKLVIEVIKSSMEEFKTLLMCLVMMALFIGSLIYNIEKTADKMSPIASIPHGVYWGIQTITTVGYGDLYPITIGGKLLAGSSMILGILTICLPVLSLVANFRIVFEKNVF